MQYYRRRRRRLYPRSRYSRRVAYGSSRSKRRALGNYRAAIQQKDSTDVNLSIPSQCTIFNQDTELIVNATTLDTRTFNTGTYALNIWDLLRKSEFYQSYSNMYDQVKINSIRVKLTPKSYTISSNNQYKAFTICTAWDRSGLSAEQLQLIQTVGTPDSNIIGNRDNNDGIYVSVSAEDVATYSSAITKSLNPNTNTSIVRSIYPSSLQEKAAYVNTADLDDWYQSYDSNTGRYYGIKSPNIVTGRSIDNGNQILAAYPLETANSNLRDTNPAYLLESPTFPFKPTLLVATMDKSDMDIEKNNITMTFNIEADIGVTFRGLRKASIVLPSLGVTNNPAIPAPSNLTPNRLTFTLNKENINSAYKNGNDTGYINISNYPGQIELTNQNQKWVDSVVLKLNNGWFAEPLPIDSLTFLNERDVDSPLLDNYEILNTLYNESTRLVDPEDLDSEKPVISLLNNAIALVAVFDEQSDSETNYHSFCFKMFVNKTGEEIRLKVDINRYSEYFVTFWDMTDIFSFRYDPATEGDSDFTSFDVKFRGPTFYSTSNTSPVFLVTECECMLIGSEDEGLDDVEIEGDTVKEYTFETGEALFTDLPVNTFNIDKLVDIPETNSRSAMKQSTGSLNIRTLGKKSETQSQTKKITQ